jgi:hypothetical protein
MSLPNLHIADISKLGKRIIKHTKADFLGKNENLHSE